MPHIRAYTQHTRDLLLAVSRLTLVSFTDLLKIQMLTLLKSQKTEVFETLVTIIHGYRYLGICYNGLLIPESAYMAERIERPEDDFFTERIALFTAQFPTYYRRPQEVLGRVHTSQERYRGTRHEIIPLREQQGTRTYVLMHPYVQEPRLTLTVGVYNQPRQYADQESPIGEVIGTGSFRQFLRR
jgi:hypothetical protein